MNIQKLAVYGIKKVCIQYPSNLRIVNTCTLSPPEHVYTRRTFNKGSNYINIMPEFNIYLTYIDKVA